MIRLNSCASASRGSTGFARLGKLMTLLIGLLGGATIVIGSHQNTQPQRAPQPSLFEKHSAQAGLTACAGVYSTLGTMVTEASSYNVASAWSSAAPDMHPMRGLVGLMLNVPQYQGPAAGVVFAIPASQGCAGGAVRVVPFPQSCAEIARQLPPGSRLVRELSGVPLYETGGNAGQVMLLSNQSGCVAISTNQIG